MANRKLNTALTTQAHATIYDSQGAGNSDNIESKPVTLLRAIASNKAASTLLWVAFFDGTSATGTPAFIFPVPAGTFVTLDFNVPSGAGWIGAPFTTGCFWAASTAAAFSQDSSSSLSVTATYLV